MIQIQDLQQNDLVSIAERDLEEVKGSAVGFLTGVAVGTFQTGVKAWFSPEKTNWGEHFTSLVGTTAITTSIGGAFGGVHGAAVDD